MRRTAKTLALVLAAGTLFHSLSCLPVKAIVPFISQAAFPLAIEWLFDNDTMVDLFPDSLAAN
jgi:hypothetical protein